MYYSTQSKKEPNEQCQLLMSCNIENEFSSVREYYSFLSDIEPSLYMCYHLSSIPSSLLDPCPLLLLPWVWLYIILLVYVVFLTTISLCVYPRLKI